MIKIKEKIKNYSQKNKYTLNCLINNGIKNLITIYKNL